MICKRQQQQWQPAATEESVSFMQRSSVPGAWQVVLWHAVTTEECATVALPHHHPLLDCELCNPRKQRQHPHTLT